MNRCRDRWLVEANPFLNSTGEFIIAYDSLEAAAAGAEGNGRSMSTRAARSRSGWWNPRWGIRLAVTRQKDGRPVMVLGGVEPGTTKTPVVLSVADVIIVSGSCKDWRLVHGVAIAGELADRSAGKTGPRRRG